MNLINIDKKLINYNYKIDKYEQQSEELLFLLWLY